VGEGKVVRSRDVHIDEKALPLLKRMTTTMPNMMLKCRIVRQTLTRICQSCRWVPSRSNYLPSPSRNLPNHRLRIPNWTQPSGGHPDRLALLVSDGKRPSPSSWLLLQQTLRRTTALSVDLMPPIGVYSRTPSMRPMRRMVHGLWFRVPRTPM